MGHGSAGRGVGCPLYIETQYVADSVHLQSVLEYDGPDLGWNSAQGIGVFQGWLLFLLVLDKLV
jgi:hypothetical protein